MISQKKAEKSRPFVIVFIPLQTLETRRLHDNFTSFSNILQSSIPEEKVLAILNEFNYIDVPRKFTVYSLFLFLAEAAFQGWGGMAIKTGAAYA
ncbi:hypothetical protein [Paenibacillus sp. GCM10012306]|uniref:hypothetical protein n=1 Tax=Paenibacillus sp. GCM10012306 TaxID=3317342 RepID=UPI003610A1BA